MASRGSGGATVAGRSGPEVSAAGVSAPGDALVAIDVGTSGARAVLFDLDGHQLDERRRSYPTRSPRPTWAEQDARAWRRAALGALRDLAGGLAAGTRVRAIGLTGQCPTVVPVDSHGEPVGPGMIYRDNRAVDEAQEMRRRWGDAAVHARTGHLPAAFHVGPKVLWLRRHRPEAYARTSRFLQPRDLVALALTGEWATDGSHAAATLFHDLRGRRWDPELLGAFDIDVDLWPPLREPWEIVGSVRPGLAARLGLAHRGPGRAGRGRLAGLRARRRRGAARPGERDGRLVDMPECRGGTAAHDLRITHYPHVVPGMLTTETGINTTGAAVSWLGGLVYGGRSGRMRPADWARLDSDAAGVAPGSDGVLALPVLGDGERSDPTLRGAFTGLSLRHGRPELARAILEGAALEIGLHLGLLRDAGVPVTELRVSGGDARLATWNQVKADVLGVPVAAIAGDAAVTGVAMLAGLGAGIYRDVDEAIARCVHVAERRAPDPVATAAYGEIITRYRELATSAVVRRTPVQLGGGKEPGGA